MKSSAPNAGQERSTSPAPQIPELGELLAQRILAELAQPTIDLKTLDHLTGLVVKLQALRTSVEKPAPTAANAGEEFMTEIKGIFGRRD